MLIRQVLFLAALALLPGIALATVAAGRGARPEPERFVALAITFGLGTWLLGSQTLARAGALHAGAVTVGAALAGLAAAVWLALPWGRDRLPDVRASWRPLGVLAAVAAVAVAPVVRLVAMNHGSLLAPTPWYYWNLVQQAVDAAGFPERSREWGTTVRFLADYPAFTAATAALGIAGGDHTSLAAAHLVTVVAALATAIAGYLFVRAWGAGRAGASVAVLLLVVTEVVMVKLASYRPEALGYGLMLLPPLLVRWWVEHRRTGDLAAACCAFATGSQVHGITWTMSALFVGAVALSALLGARGTWRHWLRGVATAGGALVGVYLGIGLLLGGGLGAGEDLGGLPSRDGGVDPTWSFVIAIGGAAPGAPPPGWRELATAALERGFYGFGSTWALAAAAAAGAAALVAAVFGPRAARRETWTFLAFLAVSCAATVAVAAWLYLRWDTYVPRRTGLGRMFQVTYVLVPVAVGVAVGAFERWPRSRDAVALLVVGVLHLNVRSIDQLERFSTLRPVQEQLSALRDLPLDDDDLVLANSYTEGFLPVVAGAPGVLDGRAPYLEADLLQRANRLLGDARAWFAAPATAPMPRVAGMTHVLVVVRPWSLGTSNNLPADVLALVIDRRLRIVHEGPGFILFAVRAGASGSPGA